MLGFARAVDDAAHHRDLEVLDAGIFFAPHRHVLAQIRLDVLRQFLEHGGSGAAAAGASGDDRHELPEAHGLQQFLRHLHLARAVAIRLRRQRDADGVADALLQKDAHGGRRGDDAFRAHAGLGEAEMQRVVGARGKFGIDGDQVLHAADLGRQDDLFAAKADLFGHLGRQDRRLHDRLARHFLRRQRKALVLVVVHQPGQQLLVERTPVDADAHRLVVLDRHLDDIA